MPRLYGFTDTAFRKPMGSEVPALREAANRRDAGQPYAEITQWLNAEGHRTTQGNEWRPSGLATVLDHPAIAGLYEDEQGSLVASGGPELIPPEQFLRIRAMRPKHREDVERAPEREYMLTGGATECGRCRHPLGSGPSNAGSRGYRCMPSTAQHPGGCGGVRINADLLENYIAEHVVAELAKPKVRDLIERARDQAGREAEDIRQRLTEDAERRRHFAEEYAKSRDISLSAFRKADKEMAKHIKASRDRLRFLEQVAGVSIGGIADLVKWWKHAPMASRRALTFLLLEKITVYPAGRGTRTVDANRVGLTWRTWGSAPKA